jgi:hypothetical protein
MCQLTLYGKYIFIAEYVRIFAHPGDCRVASERIIQSDDDVEKHLGRNTAAYVIVLHKYVNI